MRDQARVVIIGAGMVGCSAAYHLAKLGWRDIVVLEQGPLFATGGSTSHAPGLMFQINSSRMVSKLAQYTTDLYARQSLHGQPGFMRVGSVEVAITPERWADLKRKHGFARVWGVEAELISAAEAGRLIPVLRTDELYGALHVPSDGIAKALVSAESLAAQAKELGVEFCEYTAVTGVEVANGRVRAVQTSNGRIATEQLLLCAGIWGPRIGRMAGVSIPLSPMEHQYVRTAPLAELKGEAREIVHPVLRHQDRSMYFRQHADCYGIGSYYHEPILVEPDAILNHADAPVMPSVRSFTPEHFAAAQEAAERLIPGIRGLAHTYEINGMFSFTPDGQSLLGESHDVRGFWVAEAVWITHGGGTGKVMAEWMVDGVPSIDLREADLNRFAAHTASPSYIRARSAQQYREVYDIIHPLQQMDHPRPVRRSPFHQRLEELGGVFFESAGWERPQWFESNKQAVEPGRDPERSGWTARYWSPIAAAEHRGTRERVAMFDLTAFTKLEVNGTGALAYLQRIASNQMDQKIGRVTYTAMLNKKGGIQCDLTVTRLAESRFLVVTGGSVGMHDMAWMRGQLPEDGSVFLSDVTSGSCCVGLWGPQARALLEGLTEDDVSNAGFPYFTAKRIFVGNVPVLAVRVSYAGELGWELYTPTEYGLTLWDLLWNAGQAYGVIAAGGAAFDSLRLEKGYRLWGADIHSDYNPYEAGIGFAVRLNKGDFLGRDALVAVKEAGITRKLCCLVLDDASEVVMGKEPIVSGDRVLGYVTSANYGYTVGKSIAYGYLPIDLAGEGTAVDIEFFGERIPATVTVEPLYDPEGTRLRS
ncbi:MAG: dependent oxidoreductase [Chloroflexi bacterium]|nr:dependent oxidoreductase [Chloroflexota bacterium]